MSPSTLQPKMSVPQTLAKIPTPYTPKLVAMLNDSIKFRVAKIHGDFLWHSHRDTDEVFYIVDGGPLTLKLRHRYDDASSEEIVTMEKGDIFVVPKGMQHIPGAENETCVLIAESKGELNTGDLGVVDRTVTIEDVRSKA